MFHLTVCFNGLALPGVDYTQSIYFNPRTALWLYKTSSDVSDQPSKWVMTADFPPKPKYAGTSSTWSTRTPVYNGAPVFSVGGMYLWAPNSGGWCLSSMVEGATSEWTYADAPSTYLGDVWYISNSLGGDWTGRGSVHGTTRTGTYTALVGWVLSDGSGDTAPNGVYTAMGGATGSKYVGTLKLTDNLGNVYSEIVSSALLQLAGMSSSSGYSTLTSSKVNDRGDISRYGSAWIIGTYSTAPGTGYWQGPASLPLKSGDASASFTRVWNPTDPVTPDPTPADITVNFTKWIAPISQLKQAGLFLEVGSTLP